MKGPIPSFCSRKVRKIEGPRRSFLVYAKVVTLRIASSRLRSYLILKEPPLRDF